MTKVIDHHNRNLDFLNDEELAELHAHMGASLSPTILWEMAHEQGLKLPTKDFREFESMVSITEKKNLDEQLKTFNMTERIQASPESMFTGIKTVVSEAYRKNNITTLELRFNPMWRTREKEIDMDKILLYATQGLERAMEMYHQVKVGIILCLDRRLTPEQNMVIVEKAIKYKDRGVVAVDLAGPANWNDTTRSYKPEDLSHAMQTAKDAGLGVTVHTGEVTGVEEMWQVVEHLKPHRIGHGILAYKDENLMKKLVETNTILEICPTSNIFTEAVTGWDEHKEIFSKFKEYGVPFTINTDWPATLSLSIRDEFSSLLNEGILTPEDILQSNKLAHEASFLNK